MATALRITPILLFSLIACKSTTSEDKYEYPDLDLSSSRLDFDSAYFGESVTRQVIVKNRGQLPMGISSIYLGEDEMEDSFSISYSSADITCPAASSARVVDLDTALPSSDDTGYVPDTGEGDSVAEDGTIILGPKCKLPVNITMSPVTVGRIYASLRVDTVTQETYDGPYPEYYWDPDNYWKIVILEGVGVKSSGNLIVSPRTVDFGHVWPDEEETSFLSISNVGEGDLTLGEPVLSDCDEGFEILSAWSGDRALAADTSALVQLGFTSSTTDPTYCTLTLTSDDADASSVDVTLEANVGDDPENVAPTVSIRQPKVGTVYASTEPLEVELNVFDANQPAETLTCKVKSAVLLSASLASCTPTDSSGHVYVDIDTDDLEQGVDTLLVTVTDGSEVTASASTTLLFKTPFPEDDDDGDGYGESSDPYDCDDSDITVYPAAAELYDLLDNDCDGIIDEGTIGYDDDGDTLSEADGDCDDNDVDSYPGAPESPDQKDNDCDDEIDEGTNRFDDDGDGFSEVENDCDDDDATVSPASTEYCDGVDNDCNGLKDQQDGCITLDSDPIVIGGIELGVTALGVGESTTMSVFVYDADGQELNYSWQQDGALTADGYNAIDDPTASSVTFTAPLTLPSGSDGEAYSIYVVVQDEDGNQAWDFVDITVYPEPVELNQTRISTSALGCNGKSEGSDTGAALFLLPALGGLMLSRRRQKR